MSFNDERLKHQGRLAEAELEAKRAAIAAKGLINSLRNLIDPFEELENLSPDMIVDQALRLGNLLAQHREKQSEVAAIRKALGR
jgi:hypothetical protein